MGASLSLIIAGISEAIAAAGGIFDVVTTGASIAASITANAAIAGLTAAEISGLSAAGLYALANTGQFIGTSILSSLMGISALSSAAFVTHKYKITSRDTTMEDNDENLPATYGGIQTYEYGLPGLPDWLFNIIPNPFDLMGRIVQGVLQSYYHAGTIAGHIAGTYVSEKAGELTEAATKHLYRKLYELYNATASGSFMSTPAMIEELKDWANKQTGFNLLFRTRDSSGAIIGPDYLSLWLLNTENRTQIHETKKRKKEPLNRILKRLKK